MKPTVFAGHNKMRIFQEEIFGPVLSVTTFEDEDEALAIANDTLYGLGAGVWTRDINRAYRFGRDIQAGRVWTNCYHLYPAHAAFGGYKKSGIGRETHKMMLGHYQQTKNVLVSYAPKAMGFFLTRRESQLFNWLFFSAHVASRRQECNMTPSICNDFQIMTAPPGNMNATCAARSVGI